MLYNDDWCVGLAFACTMIYHGREDDGFDPALIQAWFVAYAKAKV